MATEKDFEEYVGKIMRVCQGVEHDIKLIYCGLREDANGENFDMVYASVEKLTLGKTIEKLYKIESFLKKIRFWHRCC